MPKIRKSWKCSCGGKLRLVKVYHYFTGEKVRSWACVKCGKAGKSFERAPVIVGGPKEAQK